MLPSNLKDYYRRKILYTDLGYLTRKALRKEIWEKAKKITTCQNCGGLNGPVRKDGLLRIVHDKYKNKKKSDPIIKQKLEEFHNRIKYKKECESMIETILIDSLTPIDVSFLFYHLEVLNYFISR